MDFLIPRVRRVKAKSKAEDDIYEIYPVFRVRSSKDLMIRGKMFYAIYNPNTGFWSDHQDVALDLIDAELKEFADGYMAKHPEQNVRVLYSYDSETKIVDQWLHYTQKQLPDNFVPLDGKLIFSNMKITREDYATQSLSYPLESCPTPAYDELMSVLYSEEERRKIEWAIGAVVSGDSVWIQKFIVFVGDAGTGKSTVLKIISKLFEGYVGELDAKAIASSSSAFSLESLSKNPLVAIQDDAELAKVEDNTKFNSLVSHEPLIVNEKFKAQYSQAFRCFIFLGTNKEVQITDARSGLLRRLIDVAPTGKKIPTKRYREIMEQIIFELPGIATHCLSVYKEDPYYYDTYFPVRMIRATNTMYNFVEEMSFELLEKDGISLKAAWAKYNEFVADGKIQYPLNKQRFKNELMPYFNKFYQEAHLEDGSHVYNYYSEFRPEKIGREPRPGDIQEVKNSVSWLAFNETASLFDIEFADCFAQYGGEDGKPTRKWANVSDRLRDLDTTKVHYVRVPANLIVIDFDIPNEDGEKDYISNYEAASKWPATYAELSKSGKGIHLHYYYEGDISQLGYIYAPHIEVKAFPGNSSLRRKLSKCNDIPIATINSGLPMKRSEKVVDKNVVQTEKGLRTTIQKCLAKGVHSATKPNIDFIYKILEDAYNSDLVYDVSDMMQDVLIFANNSTNNAAYCLDLVGKMKFKSATDRNTETSDSPVFFGFEPVLNSDGVPPIIFFDVEVFPNLFLINWKYPGSVPVVRMINPSPQSVEELFSFRLIGFNNRRYDNHILYAAMMGYNNEQLYSLSQKIISGDKKFSGFAEAYNLSYADVYDFCSKKQSLKKWEIELGIHHKELGFRWDEPVPEEHWMEVAEYCDNDVLATEAVFNARAEDFAAREILAEVSGLTVNDTNQQHTAKIIFGNDRHPQDQFVYTDLSEMFPGYIYENGKSFYRGEDPGEGGYVYAEPGMYGNVALLDIASMHPNSLIQLNLFGDKYTANFKQLLDARLAIKHRDFESAGKMLNGALKPYLGDINKADALAYALKIVINSVYGLTSATFDNKFRDPRNIDNIVAKRGALFMINLKYEVQARGYTVAHIKTDSIKIPDADESIISFVMDYGRQYGYTFEHEATYEKMCLVNDAVYIAKYKDGKHAGEWTPTGAQFQHPYVFKALFSGEPIIFEDMCETKTVTSGALYLDMNESISEHPSFYSSDDKHDYIFVGKVGQFCPIKWGCGGGILLREKDGKYYAVTGTKISSSKNDVYRWLESEAVKNNGKETEIDTSYFNSLVDKAVATISQYGDVEWFRSDDPYLGDIPIPFDADKAVEKLTKEVLK